MRTTTHASLRDNSSGTFSIGNSHWPFLVHMKVGFSHLGLHTGWCVQTGTYARVLKAASPLPLFWDLRHQYSQASSGTAMPLCIRISGCSVTSAQAPSMCPSHTTPFVSIPTLLSSFPPPSRRFASVRRPSAPLHPTCPARRVRPRSPCPPCGLSSASRREETRTCVPVHTSVVRCVSTMRMATNAIRLATPDERNARRKLEPS